MSTGPDAAGRRELGALRRRQDHERQEAALAEQRRLAEEHRRERPPTLIGSPLRDAAVDPQPGETWLLVTSAFHMPRSVGLFRKAGFAVVPWPVDYRTAGDEGYGFFVDNAIDSLQNTTLGIREWIGLLAYWLTGRTDQLLPGPA